MIAMDRWLLWLVCGTSRQRSRQFKRRKMVRTHLRIHTHTYVHQLRANDVLTYDFFGWADSRIAVLAKVFTRW